MAARNDLVTLVTRSINNGHHPQSWTKTVPGLTTLGQHTGLHPQDWKRDLVDHSTGLINGNADHPRTAGDADNPKTAQPTQLSLGLNISDLVHMGADPRAAQQNSQHPFGTAATPDWSLAFNFSDYHQPDDDINLSSSSTLTTTTGFDPEDVTCFDFQDNVDQLCRCDQRERLPLPIVSRSTQTLEPQLQRPHVQTCQRPPTRLRHPRQTGHTTLQRQTFRPMTSFLGMTCDTRHSSNPRTDFTTCGIYDKGTLTHAPCDL